MTDFGEKNILAIETSTRSLKLALQFGGDRLVKSEEVVQKSHGGLIIKKINELFSSAGLERTDLDGIVASVGPGSFTGLRIGLAVAKGLAVGLNIPVVGVSLFELAAARFRDANVPLHVVVPFKRDAFFVGLIEDGHCDPDRVTVVHENEIADTVGKGRVIGAGFDAGKGPSTIEDSGRLEFVEFDAADLIHVGAYKFSEDKPVDLVTLEPLYLQKSQAEIKFEQRRKQK